MAGVFRVLGAATVAAPLAGCEHATPPLVSLTSAVVRPAAPDYWTTIAAARAARDRAASIPTPTAASFAAASEDAIAESLRQWASARRDATQAAHRAYIEALVAAEAPAERAEVHGELADLWLRLEEDTRSALFAATPAGYRDEPLLVGAVQSATVYALRPLLERVASHLDDCGRVAREATPEGTGARLRDAVSACADVARRLDDDDDPRAPGASRQGAPAAPPRATLSTTHPKPCTFKGTLATHGTVYASESGTDVVLSVDGSTPIEVESLAVASKPGGRYRVSVAWPKAVDGYLETNEPPFVLARQVDLGPDEVWNAGERFAASDALGPTVRVMQSAAAAPNSVRRLFCHDLDLATTPRARGGR